MPTVMERVQEVVADKLSVDASEVVSEASFTEDLNADSLDLVELIMAFEEEFGTDDNEIQISDEDAEKRALFEALGFTGTGRGRPFDLDGRRVGSEVLTSSL